MLISELVYITFKITYQAKTNKKTKKKIFLLYASQVYAVRSEGHPYNPQ